MNIEYWDKILGDIKDVNPAEIAEQISNDSLGRFCKNVQDDVATALENMRRDGYLNAEPVVHAHWEVEVRHYTVEDDDFGTLQFYGNCRCSKCKHKVGEIRLGKIELSEIQSPLYPDEIGGSVNPYGFYPEQEKIAKERLLRSEYDFGNYCCNCGAKMDEMEGDC